MKKFLGCALISLALQVSSAWAGVIEDWSNVVPSTNTGTYADSTGSKIDFATDAGPSGAKAIKLTITLAQGGYAGIWHNISTDLSQAGNLVFMAKSTVAGEMQMALKDAYNMQYISNFQVAAGDWAPVTIAVSSFIKDPYYTPSDAVTGHPMDLSKTTGMNLASHIVGAAVIEVGPVSTDKGGGAANASAGASAASAPAAAAPAVSNGSAVVVSDFSTDDPKTYGTFQDSNGSSYVVSFKTGPKKKYLFVTYNYVNGGYCGMWCRAGQTWDGISLVGAKNLTLTVFSKDPVVLGLALKDKNNNQYVAEAPSTKGGGKWENITVSLDSFKLDPYYTPPDAVKGAAQDFSLVKTFNIQPKTVGKFVFAVDKVVAK